MFLWHVPACHRSCLRASHRCEAAHTARHLTMQMSRSAFERALVGDALPTRLSYMGQMVNVPEAVLSSGQVLQDPKGKPYYWHTETNKVQWNKPNADTPIK
jgi:hypothetical protein